MRTYYGKQAQIDKVIEELKELQQAIKDNDVRHIAEECADVEVVIPYIEVVYQLGSLPTVKYAKHRYDYMDISEILIIMLEVRINTGKGEFDKAMKLIVEHLAYSLYELYSKYKITREDIEEIKDEKYRRTIVRTVKKIIGG